MQKFWFALGAIVVIACMFFGGAVQAAALNYGDIVVVDDQNNKIWLVDPTDTLSPQTISSNDKLGVATHAIINGAGQIFVANAGTSRGILQIDPVTGNQTLFATVGANGLTTPAGIALEGDGSFIVTDSNLGAIYRVSSDGLTVTSISPTSGSDLITGNTPYGVAIDPSSGAIIVAVQDTGSIVSVDPITGNHTLLTTVTNSRDVAVDGDGTIYIAAGSMIVQWDGFLQTLATTPSPGTLYGIALDDDGNIVAAGPGSFNDSVQGKVVSYDLDSSSTTLLPNGFFADFKPVGIAVYATVPEPSTGLILAAAMVGGMVRRRWA